MTLAIEHTKRQVFPFQWSQWWRLAVLGLATAELNGSGCQSGIGNRTPSPPADPSSVLGPWLDRVNLPVILAVIAAAAIVTFLILLLFLYISSICRFVLIDAIVARRCAGIRSGWVKRRHVGRRYFRWQLVYHTAIGIGLALVFLPALVLAYASGWLRLPETHLAPLIVTGLVVALVLATLVAAAIVVYVLAKDFLAPILAIDDISVREAWGRLLRIIRADAMAFAGYLGLKCLLSIAWAVAMFAVALVLVVPLLIGAIVASAGGFSPGSAVGLAALAGVMAAGGLLVAVVLAAIGVPFVVFFPASGLYFLAARYPPLDAWLAAGAHPVDALPTT